jgi:hypothetical protein
MKTFLFPFDRSQMAAEDARSIVPIVDEHGGLMIYRHGRPSYYCLNGEWFEAVAFGTTLPERGDTHADGGLDEGTDGTPPRIGESAGVN